MVTAKHTLTAGSSTMDIRLLSYGQVAELPGSLAVEVQFGLQAVADTVVDLSAEVIDVGAALRRSRRGAGVLRLCSSSGRGRGRSLLRRTIGGPLHPVEHWNRGGRSRPGRPPPWPRSGFRPPAVESPTVAKRKRSCQSWAERAEFVPIWRLATAVSKPLGPRSKRSWVVGPDKNDCAWPLSPVEIGGRETIAGHPRLIGLSGQEPISGEEKPSLDHPVRTADERVDWCSGLTGSGLLVLALAGEGEFHWSRATTSSGTCPPTREAVSGRWDTLSASVSSCRWAANVVGGCRLGWLEVVRLRPYSPEWAYKKSRRCEIDKATREKLALESLALEAAQRAGGRAYQLGALANERRRCAAARAQWP